jgi:predicted permease
MERDMEAELQFHILSYAEDLMRGGLAREEAFRRARLAFGGIDRAKEECRDARGVNLADGIIQDMRYALRMLGKNPGFSAIAVLTLALGIGANTAIFSLTNTILLKMLPVPHPEQLVYIDLPNPEQGGGSYGFSYPMYCYLRDHKRVLSGIFAFERFDRLNVTVGEEAEVATGQIVSGEYYTTLGVRAAAGRTITPDDDRTGQQPFAATISHGYWKRRFGLDPGVVGRDIVINGCPFRIVGVTPPEFFGVSVGESPELTLPMIAQPQVMPGRSLLGDNTTWWLTVMGRLGPGVSQEQARVDVDLSFHQSAPKKMDQLKIAVIPGGKGLSEFRDRFSKPLLALMALVGLVLGIACANVAGLLLARASARRKEIALRLALGARRRRLIRQLLTESVLLSGLAGIIGLAVAAWMSSLLINMVSNGRIPISIDLHLDGRVLGFTAAISFLTGILFGVAPAFRITKLDLGPELRTASRVSGLARSHFMLGKALVISQVALSLLLVVGSGLFVRTLRNLETQDLGFKPENVLTFEAAPILIGYHDRRNRELYTQMLDRIGNVPGVRAVTAARFPQLTRGAWEPSITVPGYVSPPNARMGVQANTVGPRYFETMGMPLLEGRDFTDQDGVNSQKVVVINETTARLYFGSANCVGRSLSVSQISGQMEIAGVVSDAKYHNLREEPVPMLFIPFLQVPETSPFFLSQMTFEARTVVSPESVAPQIRREVQLVDKDLPVFAIKTLAEQVDESLVRERLVATLSSFFGLLALALGCVGLYGLMSYKVAQRTNEIGIRMALGAQRGKVSWMVLMETLVLVSAGILIGLPIALASTRLVSSMLFGLSPIDPTTIAGSVLLMMTICAVAGFLPAWKASRVDPIVALRYE